MHIHLPSSQQESRPEEDHGAFSQCPLCQGPLVPLQTLLQCPRCHFSLCLSCDSGSTPLTR